MFFRPKPLSAQTLDGASLRADKKNCRRFGPCGVGQEALYMGGFFFERSRYVPYAAVERIYKQVAMSKGGFTGRGLFGAIPYLVAEYDGGRVCRSKFKWEEDVDRVLECVHDARPDMPLRSLAAQKRLEEEEAEIRSRLKEHLSEEARRSVAELERAGAFLERRPEVYRELARTSKAKRANDIANPFYKWAALAIVILAGLAALFGAYVMWTGQGDFGLYFLLFGMAFILLFSSANVLPTKRNNEAAVRERLYAARRAMEAYLYDYVDFPVPARYAHPLTLRRMKREIREGRAETVRQAFELLKEDLKAVNSSMTVYQFEYDEIVAVKPMFLIEDYR